MSCNDEHSGHDHHDHSHNHSHADGHDHSDDLDPATKQILFSQIDFDKIRTLNEEEPDSGAAIVKKTWQDRDTLTPELKSDTDEQVLMVIPFTGQVRLQSILLRGSNDGTSPKTLKIFLNDPDLDFSAASTKPATQTLEIPQSSSVIELPVKRARFNTTRSLTLFFEDNWSDGEEDQTVISYLAFKGDFMKLNREAVSVLYEAAANPADHKAIVGIGGTASHQIE